MKRSALLLLTGLLVLAPAPGGPHSRGRGSAQAKEKKAAFPEHVVLVILGGGVRSADMLDAKLMPTLAEMGAAGRVIRKISARAPSAYGAATRILTGCAETGDVSKFPRPAHATLCEYVRKARGLPPEKVYFVSYEGGDALHLAHSLRADYGAVFAPATAHGFGAFAEPLRSFLEKLGRPLPMEPESWAPLRRLRLLSRTAREAWLPRHIDAGLPRAERVERALLRELDRKALLLPGPNARDEQALRAAQTILEIHRPVLTVIRLGEAEKAQASFDTYREVLRANDAGIARLRASVAKDERLSGRTTFLVVADRGRNERPGSAGRLEASDESRQRTEVNLIFEGPGLRRRPSLKGPRALEDICPTIGLLLGVSTPACTGKAWATLLEER